MVLFIEELIWKPNTVNLCKLQTHLVSQNIQLGDDKKESRATKNMMTLNRRSQLVLDPAKEFQHTIGDPSCGSVAENQLFQTAVGPRSIQQSLA